MTEFNHAWIDEQLRSVALPPELLARLREIAAWGDSELDHSLCDIAMPPALVDRLHAIGSLTETDVDDDARHVAVPPELVPRLRRSIRREAMKTRLARLAIAASLLFAIGGGGWLLVREFGPGGDPKLMNHELASIPSGDHRPAPTPDEKATPDPNKPPQVVIKSNNNSGNDGHWLDKFPPWPTVLVTPLPMPTPAGSVHPIPPDFGPEQGLNPAGVLGNPTLATQPDLRVARGDVRHGIAGPRVKGYDLAFELRTGEHPTVDLGKVPALVESRVPIWNDTSSYELAERMIEAHQILPASRVRAEDFLAAMDYDFPAPSGSAIGIRTAAGPSPLGTAGTSLMQIGVQGGKFDRGHDFGTNLTLAVDVSATVGIAGRWTAVRRAIADLVEQLGPRDRLSIVLFNQRPLVLVRQADRTEMKTVLPLLDTISPRGIANLGAALEIAADLARQEPAAGAEKSSARLLLLTDGVGWIDPGAMPRAKELLKQTVAGGAAWEVVDVRPDAVSDPRLEELAAVGGHAVRHAETGRAIKHELREALLGRPDIVANGVSIKVTFNPDAVESYRLIGHDPTTAGGLISGPLEGDLRAGEAATALYELELKPDGADTIATVEVTWHEPGTEDVHHRKQVIGRLQFAPSWIETPLSLQLATLAAETAGILRGSVFAPPSLQRPLDQVAELADRANSALQSRGSFVELKGLIDAARAPKSAGH